MHHKDLKTPPSLPSFGHMATPQLPLATVVFHKHVQPNYLNLCRHKTDLQESELVICAMVYAKQLEGARVGSCLLLRWAFAFMSQQWN